MLCSYGCGQESKFTSVTNKPCCSESYKKCPGVLAKNKAGTKRARDEGRKGYTYNPKSNWNTGNVNAVFAVDGSGNHKGVLISERGHACECCKFSEWMGSPITLELEHVDGNTRNNVKENLKLLCPNCQSQTPTWRRRKSRGTGAKFTEVQMADAIISSYNMHQALNKLNLKWGSSATLMKVKDKLDLKFKTK